MKYDQSCIFCVVKEEKQIAFFLLDRFINMLVKLVHFREKYNVNSTLKCHNVEITHWSMISNLIAYNIHKNIL